MIMMMVMSEKLKFLLFFTYSLYFQVIGELFTWKPTVYTIYSDGIIADGPIYYHMTIYMEMNGKYFDNKNNNYNINSNNINYTTINDNTGNFRVNFSIYSIPQDSWFYGLSPCFPIDSSSDYLSSILPNTIMRNEYASTQPLSYFMSVKVKRYANISSIYSKISYVIKFTATSLGYLNTSISTLDCIPLQRIGKYSDFSQWEQYSVPSESDDVYIPPNSGIIVIDSDITLNSLNMSGGLIIASKSSCPSGYISVNTIDSVDIKEISKCYALNSIPLSFTEAVQECSIRGGGYLGAGLVEIGNRVELDTVKHICRGNERSPTQTSGCWIGLKYNLSTNISYWIESLAVSPNSFRDWNRYYQINVDYKSGDDNYDDENDVSGGILLPWQMDPLSIEQGSMSLRSFDKLLPSVCQTIGNTQNYNIIARMGIFQDAHIMGGRVMIQSGLYKSLSLSQTILTIGSRYSDSYSDSYFNQSWMNSSFSNIIQSIVMTDSAEIHLYSDVIMNATSYIGELNQTTISKQTLVNIYSNATIYSNSSDCTECYGNITINAYVVAQGCLNIGENINLILKQGGDFSQAVVYTNSFNSTIVITNDAIKMESFDSFDLTLSHRGPVTEEITTFSDTLLSSQSTSSRTQMGVYRLLITLQNISTHTNQILSSEYEVTSCIPYNATANLLQTILSDLSVIRSFGGAVIRRYGSDSYYDSMIYNYGYTYRIDIDAPPTSTFTYDHYSVISIDIYCYGSDRINNTTTTTTMMITDNILSNSCGCAETKVPKRDHHSGIRSCPRNSKSSFLDPNSCVFPPTFSINRITKRSRTVLKGSGSILLTNGIHRLPAISDMNIILTNNAIGIVSGDRIEWPSLSMTSNAMLLVTGVGWTAWDSVNILYLSPSSNDLIREDYGLPSYPIPRFYMNVPNVRIQGDSKLYTAAPGSNITITNLYWSGGEIGGEVTVDIQNDMIATISNEKILRYGMILHIDTNASFHWMNGNITMMDGAKIVVDGNFSIAINSISIHAIGYTMTSIDLQQPGRRYDSKLDTYTKLRGGWYPNPLCNGTQCLDTIAILLQNHAILHVTSNTNISFLIPLNLLDQSRVFIDSNAYAIMSYGGICGNKVIVELSSQATIGLTDGYFAMEKTCTLRGQGELIVSGGSHDLAYSIDAHITITGYGQMTWPTSRGIKGTITFNGGLLIESYGILQILPFSTTMIIHNEVMLRENATIRFPDIGIASQPTPSDRSDAPDNSPRGNFTITGNMGYYGGTLSGKVDINVLSSLYLDGTTKYIQSLAKLVNYGLAVWGTGDIILDTNADFLNLGQLQIREGLNPNDFTASVLVHGVILPLQDGGDVFAQNYHSWDMDEGHLSYSEYIKLRTEFVSRTPDGWTENLQKSEDVIDPL